MLHSLWRRLIRFGFRLLYNELAWSYDAVSWLASRGAWRDWQRAALPHVNGPDALEIGHGPGHLLLALRRAGLRVVGLELSPFMLRLARRRLARAGLLTPLARARAEALPFAPACFDTVLATFPTDYVLAAETLTAVARVLKPHGRFIIVPSAALDGRDPLTRGVEWLYCITGQRGNAFAPEEASQEPNPAGWIGLWARLADAGFDPQIHSVQLARSRVTVIVAQKTQTAA